MRALIRMLSVIVTLMVVACGSQEQPVASPAPPPATAPVSPATPPAEPVAPAPAPSSEPVQAVTEAPKVVAEAPKAVTEAPKAVTEAPKVVAPAPAPVSIDVPELVTLEASQGPVTLSHLDHAKAFPCATCHGDGTPGALRLGKDAAHTLCRDCHKAKGAGPTSCTGCHKK
jgi:cytoskeletal protein RodZ